MSQVRAIPDLRGLREVIRTRNRLATFQGALKAMGVFISC